MNSVIIPNDVPLQRKFRKALSAEKLALYEAGKLGEFDYKTIFYDIFIAPHGNQVIAIGPPPLNMYEYLFPAILRINNRDYLLKNSTSYNKIFIQTADIKIENNTSFPISAELLLANGMQFKLSLERSLPQKGAAIVTVQKNNRFNWIHDWINYYKYEFGINDVYIYDNNSENQQKLIDSLGEKANIIPWNFPFGILEKSSNKFCQVGALNHFKLRYGSEYNCIFNFDIDELLVCKNISLKKQLLSGDLVRFDGYKVPHVDFGDAADHYSYMNYQLRKKESQKAAYKYVMPGNINAIMDVHHIIRPDKWWFKFFPDSLRYGKIANPDDAYFLHYRGISTHWKKHKPDRRMLDANTPESVIEDNSVPLSFSKKVIC